MRPGVLAGCCCAAALLASLLAGCSSGGSGSAARTAPAAPASASLPPSLVAKFQAAQTAPLAALKNEQDPFSKLPQAVTGPQFAPVLLPLADATRTFDDTLRTLPWPSSLQADVSSLVTANSQTIADYGRITSGGQQGKVVVFAELQKDYQQQTTMLDRLREDVGLAPL